MALTREEVQHIATLCRIGLTPEDVERFRTQLSHILEVFEVLKRVDTTGVEPTGHAVELHTVMRDDVPRPSFDREEVLRIAPRREGDFFRVRAVLGE